MARTYLIRQDADAAPKGPYTPAEIREMAARGEFSASDSVQIVGAEAWFAARQIKGLFPASPRAEPAAVPAARGWRGRAMLAGGALVFLLMLGGGGLGGWAWFDHRRELENARFVERVYQRLEEARRLHQAGDADPAHDRFSDVLAAIDARPELFIDTPWIRTEAREACDRLITSAVPAQLRTAFDRLAQLRRPMQSIPSDEDLRRIAAELRRLETSVREVGRRTPTMLDRSEVEATAAQRLAETLESFLGHEAAATPDRGEREEQFQRNPDRSFREYAGRFVRTLVLLQTLGAVPREVCLDQAKGSVTVGIAPTGDWGYEVDRRSGGTRHKATLWFPARDAGGGSHVVTLEFAADGRRWAFQRAKSDRWSEHLTINEPFGPVVERVVNP